MKFDKAKKEALILDPTYNGENSRAVLKGKKDHNDEAIELSKDAKGQKPAGKK